MSSLKQLRHPAEPRRPFSLITASRLAPEKHLDWLVRAVIEARQTLPELTLDIYGQGADYAKLQKIIADAHAADYIPLKRQQDPTTVYPQYAACLGLDGGGLWAEPSGGDRCGLTAGGLRRAIWQPNHDRRWS